MKLFNLAKYALTITMGAAMLAACSNSGGSSLAPFGTSSGMPGITHAGTHPNLIARQSGLFSPDKFLPDRKKKKQPYQYISDFNNSTVLEFDYPKGDASIGSISGVSAAQGECTNALFGTGKKTFWVTSANSSGGEIDEFKVGGTSPMAILKTPFGDIPDGCAMNPRTGDLAATIINNGTVVIYKKASGTGTVSQTPLVEAFFDGFDTKGNLYVDGFNSGSTFGFVELKKGTSTWETLSLSNSISFPGGVQYDGKYITIGDQTADDIYGYMCSGTSCTLKRTVSGCGGGWIANGYAICGAEIVKYPAGGIIARLGSSYFAPLGAVQVEK